MLKCKWKNTIVELKCCAFLSVPHVYLSGMLNDLDRKSGSQYIQCAILLKATVEFWGQFMLLANIQ